MSLRDKPPLPQIPPSLRRLMAEICPVWGRDIETHIARMTEAFSEVLRHAPSRGVNVVRDVPHGPHPSHRLDVYKPPQAGSTAGLVFVHGGAFVKGDRSKTPEIYANVLRYFRARFSAAWPATS
jgi:acetyl esterase